MFISKPNVVIIGRLLADVSIRCQQFPDAGKTEHGKSLKCIAAGEAVNQAIQAALCGCNVYIVGKVGKDIFAQKIRDTLNEYGINCDFLLTAEAKSTGSSVSFIDNSGNSQTVITQGANKALTHRDIRTADFEQLSSNADICMINASLDSDFVCAAIRQAKLCGAKVILEPAVKSENLEKAHGNLPLDYYTADILVPNFAQAAELSTASQSHNIHTAKLIGSDLMARGIKDVVIKLGSKGAMVVNKNGAKHIPAFSVQCINHSCCGDAFNGALAASCAVGDQIDTAVKFATAAGALACSKFGTVEALPQKAEIIEMLQNEA